MRDSTTRTAAHRMYKWLVSRGYHEAYAVSVSREVLNAENLDYVARTVKHITRAHCEEE